MWAVAGRSGELRSQPLGVGSPWCEQLCGILMWLEQTKSTGGEEVKTANVVALSRTLLYGEPRSRLSGRKMRLEAQ